MTHRLSSADPGFERALERVLDLKRTSDQSVVRDVTAILDDVRRRGDAAVIDHTRKFDRLDLAVTPMKIDADEIASARAGVPAAVLAALDLAAARIEAFHARQIPDDVRFRDETGTDLGYRWTAIDAVGLYVPGGRAAYPSSVLMNAIPARVAGVSRLVMVVPAPGGALNPMVLAAAHRAGVGEIYRIGGAQAIGALAFGTGTIRPVDKIIGPGNAYVAEAKRQVFGTVGIDMIAGPSEILVVADRNQNPDWIAVDLLSQAEHDPVAQSVLVTDDAAFADAVERAIASRLANLPRAGIAAASWSDFGVVIVVRDLDEAPSLVDRFAPEHCELAVADPDRLADRIRHAGALFLGALTPEAIGDYVGGPNHVLPTSRSARFASGLGVLDFLKRTTILRCDAASLAAIGPAAVRLAEVEGLEAHALSVRLRLKSLGL